jgi:hypothetical protein
MDRIGISCGLSSRRRVFISSAAGELLRRPVWGALSVALHSMGSRVFRQLGGQCRIRTGLRIPSLCQPRSRGAFFRVPASPMELSAASNPSVIAHARNDSAAIDALASSDASCKRRTRRSRLCGNRGPTNARANSAASSSVRTVTSRARRRGGSNTKFVMHRKRASHNRSSGGAI